jgi:DNA-binding CsgD family transcriptional regulator
MDSSLNTIAADRGATAILRVANQDGANPAQAVVHLPKELQDFLKDHDTNDPPANLQFRAGNAGYNCRAFVMHLQNGQPLVALHFQKDASVSNAIARVAALYHLTEREQQALEGIAAGLTSKEIAAGMNISPNTVKSFLRITMLKMGVATRVGLVGKLLEYKENHSGDSHV